MRVEPYGEAMKPIDACGVTLYVNACADVVDVEAPEGNLWIDVEYPRYRATLHLTLVECGKEEMAVMLERRLERVETNTGGFESEITELVSPGGFSSTIIMTPEATVTPVQYVASCGDRLVTATLEMKMPVTDPAQISPVVSAVYRDLIRCAANITRYD